MTAPDATKEPTGLDLYSRAAEAACNQVIAAYSTSFGWATRLLSSEIRQPVRNIYAMVRVADEIVDGAAAEASALGGGISAASALDAYEDACYRAMADGFATDLVLHAFARTANRYGFGRDLVAPFFASMRADLTESAHDQESFERYIYGSAEVVGLMCLRVFVGEAGRNYSEAEIEGLEAGARALGSAFQKVNFLRDISADFNRLGRSYFPGITPSNFTDAARDKICAEISAETDLASTQLKQLPSGASKAVAAALLLFAELNRKIAKTPAAQIAQTRIRVGNASKLALVVKAYLGVTNA